MCTREDCIYSFDELDIFGQHMAVARMLTTKIPDHYVKNAGDNIAGFRDPQRAYELAIDLMRQFAIMNDIRFDKNGNSVRLYDMDDYSQSIMDYLHSLK
jgi:hypothetical protein